MTEQKTKDAYIVIFHRVLAEHRRERLAVLVMVGKDEEDIKSQLINSYKGFKFPDKVDKFSSIWCKTEITKVIKRFAEEGCPDKIKDDLGELYEGKPDVFEMDIYNVHDGCLVWDKQVGW